MRARTAVGLFLAIGGAMVLLLHPVYRGTAPDPGAGVEAAGPVQAYHPVPGWVGALAVVLGGALLASASEAASRRRRR